MSSKPSARKPVILAPGAGRAYPMGRISALFKASLDHYARLERVNLRSYDTGVVFLHYEPQPKV